MGRFFIKIDKKTLHFCFLILLFLANIYCFGKIRIYFAPVLSPPEKLNDPETIKKWIENMVLFHDYKKNEIGNAFKIDTPLLLQELQSVNEKANNVADNDLPFIMPFPGGHHPRLGFFESSIMPVKETKLSIFLSFNPKTYLVLDIPEAIWIDSKIRFLAHKDSSCSFDRIMPVNGWKLTGKNMFTAKNEFSDNLIYQVDVKKVNSDILFRFTLSNQSEKKIENILIQNCLILSSILEWMPEFKEKMSFNPLIRKINKHLYKTNPCLPIESDSNYGILKLQINEKIAWLIFAASPTKSLWDNPMVPCMHSDLHFNYCEAKNRVEGYGIISFYIAKNYINNLERLKKTRWETGRYFYKYSPEQNNQGGFN